jgi:glycosyltransferase involved in cell wall biosynthesis
MKIAYIYDAVYPWVKGGAEKRIYEISKRLVERGHKVHWFGLKWWDGEKDILKDGINLHAIGEWSNLYVDGRRSIKEGLYFGIKTLTGLKGDFDVIDCQEFPYFSCFSAKIHSVVKRTPLIITWHEVWGDYWFEYLGKKGIFGWSVENLTAKLTNKNIAVSKRTKEDLERIGVKNIHVVPNGTDFKKIEKVKPLEEETDVIFAGRLIKEKHVDILIRGIDLIKNEIPDVKCVIIGDGPEKRTLESLVNDFGLDSNVRFIGFLENYDDVISHMKSSKVFVSASTREGFGIVALEANACGLPVVTVKHPRNAICDLITDGETGFICELFEQDIAQKVLQAIDAGNSLREKCLEYASGYDWNGIANKVETFYRGTVAK